MIKEDLIMEKNQKINCTVKSCEYQNDQTKTCSLQSIQVAPVAHTNTKTADESMCASYKCCE